MTGAQPGAPQRSKLALIRGDSVPWWGVACSMAPPVLLIAGWTIAARLQPVSYDPIRGSVSALAALGAADRWVMTLAFLLAGAGEIMTGLALRPAAAAGRLLLVAGGVTGMLVAASPLTHHGSVRHAVFAGLGLAALAAWPAAARRRGSPVPWALRPAIAVGASLLLTGALVWFAAELVTGAGQAGLAERILGGMQTLWPPLVVASCRLSQR